VPAGPPPRAAYFDSSALVKLIVPERESLALRTAILDEEWEVIVSSVLAHTEVLRAVSAADGSAEVERVARAVLSEAVLLDASPAVLDDAAAVAPASVRSLDAIHMATAASAAAGQQPLVPADLAAVVTYDARMAGPGVQSVRRRSVHLVPHSTVSGEALAGSPRA
jgi:predicted nucleic acid-binding protein